MRGLLHKVWNILTASSKEFWSQAVCRSETEMWLKGTHTLNLPVRLQLHLLQVLLFQFLLSLLVRLEGHRWQMLSAEAVIVDTAFQT